MATGNISLFPGGSPPDNSGSGNNAAALESVVSTGSQTSNTPKVTRWRLALDPATDEHWQFQFLLPQNYSSGGTLRFLLSCGATTGNVVMKGGQVTAAGSGSVLDDVYAAADLSSATAVPGTANQDFSLTITLTATNMAVGRLISIFIGRDADNASDTVNSNDIHLWAVNFEYTTT